MTDAAARLPHAGRILVAEDDPSMRELLVRTLQRAGYEVRSAENGAQALEEARGAPPDLVISDLIMPEMSGAEFCQSLRADPAVKDVFFIFLSAKSDLHEKVVGLDLGADDFIAKPFHRLELLARVRAGLRIKLMQDLLKIQVEELRAAQEKLQATQGQLVQAEKMAGLGLLAGGVAHEFNNILGGVLGYCDLALQDGSPAYLRRTVELTLNTLQRAVEITRSLRDFARRRKSTREPVDLAKALDETLTLVRHELEKEGIEIRREVEPLPDLLLDAGRMQQVFLNMLINARQAMEGRGGGTLTVRLGREGDHVAIRFQDSGVGIPPENLPRIFDPFFTTKGSFGGGTQSGTGLGLSVSLGIIQNHGGTIAVESVPDRGTTFIIRLPFEPAAGTAPLSRREPAAPRSP